MIYIEDLSKHSGVSNSGDHVSEGKVVLEKGYPHCKEHGAMLKVSKDGIWRCPACHVGCFGITGCKR